MSVKPLNTLNAGNTAVIKEFVNNARLQSRLVEMGAIPGVKVRIVKKAPFHGPIEVKIRSYHLILRWQDAGNILVS